MRVRATRPFTAYHAPSSSAVPAVDGQEFDGEIAAYLASTGAPVEVIEADPDPVDGAPDGDPDGGSGAGDPDGPERVDDDPAPPPAFDPAEHTVDDVLAYVAAHPTQRAAVRLLEEAGKQRTTILRALD